jgi:predicted nucleotidyltransferase
MQEGVRRNALRFPALADFAYSGGMRDAWRPRDDTVARQAFHAIIKFMSREDIIARLRENEAALRARGVAHAALFGSRARGDARPNSDTDIMVEIAPDAPVGVYEYVRIKEYIASLFEGPVDVVNREGLKPYVRPAVTSDAVYAF